MKLIFRLLPTTPTPSIIRWNGYEFEFTGDFGTIVYEDCKGGRKEFFLHKIIFKTRVEHELP